MLKVVTLFRRGKEIKNPILMKSPQLTELTATEMETISGGLARRGGRGLLLLLLLLLLLRRRQTEVTAAE